MPRINTERLLLTPLSGESLQTALDDFQQMEDSLGLEMTEQRLGEPVRRAIAMKLNKIEIDPANYAWYTYWLIILPSENKAIGMIGFKGLPDEKGEVEIGYGINAPYQHQGYATEAVRAMVRWAFEQNPQITITAETFKDNLASQQVLQNAGFVGAHETELSIWWQLSGAN